MRVLSRWMCALAWDGLLPLVVLVVPTVAHLVLVGHQPLELVFAVLVPTAAALLRCLWADERLSAEEDAPSLARQMAFSSAIMSLLFFEAVSGLLIASTDEPSQAWIAPVAAYFLYLASLGAALGVFQNDAGSEPIDAEPV
jgi:hypothetical protein